MSQLIKICEQCGAEFDTQFSTVQKYCSKSCKEKKGWLRAKKAGKIRAKKGGYNRSTYINLFMNARQSDQTAPCHYCQSRVTPDNFVLDHKVPISSLSTRDQIMDPTNLVVCCRSCNISKGTNSYEDFIKQKETHG
jgi:5-methylcytosine-specific restriction endonuclease McrA